MSRFSDPLSWPTAIATARSAALHMTSANRVLVTGASGNVGSATITALHAAGITARAADRNIRQVSDRFPTAEFTQFDFLDPSTFDAAVDGCDALLLLRPPPISRMKHTLNQLIDVAAHTASSTLSFRPSPEPTPIESCPTTELKRT